VIGDRVRWTHTDQQGQPLFPDRGGVIRAVALANGQWHVLVQHANGTYSSELASNLEAVEPGSSIDVLERAWEREACNEAITQLGDYIVGEGLLEDVPEPCQAAIDLLRTFQAELLAVGAARDTAQAAHDAAVAREQPILAQLTEMRTARDAAIAELEAAKKRKRPPGRLSEDA